LTLAPGTYHLAGHALLQPLGPFPGSTAHLTLCWFGLDGFQLGDESPVPGTLPQPLWLEVELVATVGPLVAAAGAHACGSEAVLGQLDIVPGQLSAGGSELLRNK